MSATREAVASEVLSTRMGVMTHLVPRSSLNEPRTLEDLCTEVGVCLERGDIQLVVDLASVQIINSAALETLADLQDQCGRLGGWLKLSNVTALVQDILRISGMSAYVPVMDIDMDIFQPPAAQPHKLGDILIAKELLTRERMEEAIQIQKRTSRRLGQILIDKHWVAEHEVLRALGEQLSVPFVRLRAGIYDPDIVTLVKKNTARRLQVLPLQRLRGELALATMDPQAIPAFDEIEQQLGCRIRPVLACREDILAAINDAYNSGAVDIEMIGDVDDDFAVVENLVPDDYAAIDELAEGSPVINLVNSIVQRAVRDGASDIHIEPSRNLSRVRSRIDGVLYEVTTLRQELHPALVSRLKVMANLDIAERRMPQDGRIQVHTQGRAVDLRFSSLPGLFGEKIVLRVLDKNQSLLDVNKLGMSGSNLGSFKGLLDNSNGLILVTGPTGSGKSTTLASIIDSINSELNEHIVTI
ncbi:MAG: ATPase, T2SS/T4P/T4SS family, partial [Gammaproteobacteria bacterium]|nr:ATPase, T2SS/T4P/T4SS family [Gammaproteobacteria bacterium]